MIHCFSRIRRRIANKGGAFDTIQNPYMIRLTNRISDVEHEIQAAKDALSKIPEIPDEKSEYETEKDYYKFHEERKNIIERREKLDTFRLERKLKHLIRLKRAIEGNLTRWQEITGRQNLQNDFGGIDTPKLVKFLSKQLGQIDFGLTLMGEDEWSGKPVIDPKNFDLALDIYNDIAAPSNISPPLSYNDGLDLEKTCQAVFSAYGLRAELTARTNDYGVDLLVSLPNGALAAVQCKALNRPCGVEAVQQVYSGAKKYDAAEAVVISEMGYTPNAEELAAKLGVFIASKFTIGLVIQRLMNVAIEVRRKN